MRLLLDEMLGAVVAEKLRDRSHDVVAVQDPGCAHLRGVDDCVLLATADDESRAVVDGQPPGLLPLSPTQARGWTQRHHGLLFFTNDSFPRHRHDLFVGQVIAALERELVAHEKDDPSGWIRWLTATR